MFKNIANFFYQKNKAIKEEIALKLKIDKIIAEFIDKEVFKKSDFNHQLSHSFNKGIIKIETDNKIIAQEIALRIKLLEERLRREGIEFRKLLV